MKSFNILVTLFVLLLVQSPTLARALNNHALWTKAIGDQLYLEECYSVRKANDGGYILAGRRSLDTSGAKSNVFLVKTDASGNVQWSKEIDPYPTFNSHSRVLSVVQADDGGYVAAGWVETENYGDEGYLVKINSTGTLQWHYIYGNVNIGSGNDDDWFQTIAKTSDGGYILGGWTAAQASHGYTDAWLVRVTGAGEIVWQTVHGLEGSEEAQEVIQTTDGGYLFVGNTTSETGFGIDDEAVFIVKTNASGVPQWFKTFDWSTYGGEMGESVRQTGDGGYLVGGWYEAGSDPGIPFLIKLNSGGNTQWSQTYNLGSGSEKFSSVALADDGYLAVGRTNSAGSGSYDALVVKTDAAGNQEWSETYGGSDYDAAYSVDRTGNSGYIVGGKAVGLQWPAGTDMYLIYIGAALDYRIYLPLVVRQQS